MLEEHRILFYEENKIFHMLFQFQGGVCLESTLVFFLEKESLAKSQVSSEQILCYKL